MVKKGLGRGLDALMPVEESTGTENNKEFMTVNISFVEPNREQPRKNFDEEELSALASSVKKYGILQPITVKSEENGFYRIIAGERRWRAAKLAGLKEVPVRAVELSSGEELEVALVENLQRTDLNPVEEALGYRKLMDEYELTQEDVSIKVGKSRSAVANALRFLALPEDILVLLRDKKLTGGHAKAILIVKDDEKRRILAQRIIDEELSVRSAEALAQLLNNQREEKERVKRVAKSPEILDLERTLSEGFGTKINLQEKRKGGKIEIEYYDAEQLETILDYLKKYKKQ